MPASIPVLNPMTGMFSFSGLAQIPDQRDSRSAKQNTLPNKTLCQTKRPAKQNRDQQEWSSWMPPAYLLRLALVEAKEEEEEAESGTYTAAKTKRVDVSLKGGETATKTAERCGVAYTIAFR
jgi:hypothetical protein